MRYCALAQVERAHAHEHPERLWFIEIGRARGREAGFLGADRASGRGFVVVAMFHFKFKFLRN